MEAVGFAFTVVATADLCLKYGKILVDEYTAFQNADVDIQECVLRVKVFWTRTSRQINFLQKVWTALDKELQTLHQEILHVLSMKLSIAISKLNGLKKKTANPPSSEGSGTEVKRWKYVFVKDSLDNAIEDLDSWQHMFDPSWFLALKVPSSLIDAQFKTQESMPSLLRNASSLRDSFRAEDPERRVPIFLPEKGLNPATASRIDVSFAKRVQRTGIDKWVIVESTTCDADADLNIVTRDVRDLARKLKCADPAEFNILQCHGVIRSVEGPWGCTSFDFVFQMPGNRQSEPWSVRKCLLSPVHHTLTRRFALAKQLANSVSYVHTFGFVHKNIRPETSLVFADDKSAIGLLALIGFDKFRMADSGTMRLGDCAWETNLYRHPHRQGLHPEEAFKMQHDIYSLGVCLLEIGIWKSFVVYEDEETDPLPGNALELAPDSPQFKYPMLMKAHLVALAEHSLSEEMGEIYEQVVVSCLTCLDKDNPDFGDQSNFGDSDGVSIGVRYIEKILHKLQSIRA